MRGILKTAAVCVACMSLSVSCRMVSSMLHDEKVVARAGSDVLYESEVLQLIPRGTSSEDSLRIVLQYAETWAKDAIILKTAEEQLSKAEKDVTAELEEYRRSLLKYRYEELFINERLDTTVTDEEIEEFYSMNSGDFILSRPIYKARYVKVYADSPDIAILKKKMSSDSDAEVYEADSIAWSSAIRFTDYGGAWVDDATLLRDMELSEPDFRRHGRGLCPDFRQGGTPEYPVSFGQGG